MGKKILKWSGNVIIGILLVLAVLSMVSMVQARRNPNEIPSVLGYKPFSVLSDSMTPLFAAGDMIVVKDVPEENIEVGDIITYKVGGNTLVTHRVIEVVEAEGNLQFRTKGDASQSEDQTLVSPQEIVGSLVFIIPKGGYIANFTRSPIGFIFLIIVPIILLILGELKTVLSEEKSKKAKLDTKDNTEIN